MKWFFIDESILDKDRRQGPYSFDEILEFVKQGKITKTTLVWHTGLTNWKPWIEIKEENEKNSKELNQRDELLKKTLTAILLEQSSKKNYAGFFTRALAFTIDNLILGIIGGIILFILNEINIVELSNLQELFKNYINEPTSTEAIHNFFNAKGMSIFLSIWSSLQAIYFICFHAIYSATIGKKICHIHVETSDFKKLTWLGSLARYLCSILTQLTIAFYGLGYLIVCIDPKRRSLHDWIAKTYVVMNTQEEPTTKSNEEN